MMRDEQTHFKFGGYMETGGEAVELEEDEDNNIDA